MCCNKCINWGICFVIKKYEHFNNNSMICSKNNLSCSKAMAIPWQCYTIIKTNVLHVDKSSLFSEMLVWDTKMSHQSPLPNCLLPSCIASTFKTGNWRAISELMIYAGCSTHDKHNAVLIFNQSWLKGNLVKNKNKETKSTTLV